MQPVFFQSICPVCGAAVPAAYMESGGAVYIEKTCPDHGPSRVLAAENAEDFARWAQSPSVTVAPRVPVTRGVRKTLWYGSERDAGAEVLNTECPYHCGVCDNHLMTACCVLLNVTTACNQHCPYCFANADMPETRVGNNALGASGLVRPAGSDPRGQSCRFGGFHNGVHVPGGEYTDQNAASIPAVKVGSVDGVHIPGGGSAPVGASALGRKFNIQLSGGEPTVRDDLADIIRLCKAKGFEYVQLNTNGRRLAEDAAYAKALKSAGLSTVFLQFDGTDDRVCLALRGEPLLAKKQSAIRNCGAAGLPVTLVPTILKNVNLPQVGAILDFMLDNLSVVKGVHFQPASFFGRRPDERNADGDYGERVTMFAVMDEIEKQTGGRVKKSDLAPISTGHPLCCFCAAFLKEADGALRPLSSGGSCCGPGETAAAGACCDTDAPDVPCCGPGATDPLEIIRRDRDFVLNKWDVPEPSETGNEQGRRGPLSTDAMSFDEAIHMFKSNMFTISGMSFMDDTNLDAERLRRCRVQVFTEDERLVPFCGYYAAAGKRWQMSEKAWQ